MIGFEEFDRSTVEKVREYAKPLLDEFDRIFGEKKLLEFKMIVDKIGQNGGPSKYEVIGSFDTTLGLFHVRRVGFRILNLVNEIVENLERQMIEKKEIVKEGRELPANA